jgi:hypothetical protein
MTPRLPDKKKPLSVVLDVPMRGVSGWDCTNEIMTSLQFYNGMNAEFSDQDCIYEIVARVS